MDQAAVCEISGPCARTGLVAQAPGCRAGVLSVSYGGPDADRLTATGADFVFSCIVLSCRLNTIVKSVYHGRPANN